MSALFTSDADPSLVKFCLLLALMTLLPVSYPYVHKYFVPPPFIRIYQGQRIPGHLILTSSTSNKALCVVEIKITQI